MVIILQRGRWWWLSHWKLKIDYIPSSFTNDEGGWDGGVVGGSWLLSMKLLCLLYILLPPPFYGCWQSLYSSLSHWRCSCPFSSGEGRMFSHVTSTCVISTRIQVGLCHALNWLSSNQPVENCLPAIEHPTIRCGRFACSPNRQSSGIIFDANELMGKLDNCCKLAVNRWFRMQMEIIRLPLVYFSKSEIYYEIRHKGRT